MKTEFIQIQDVNEIDTTKVTVYDLNKRFVDRVGNMYGLRYNRDQKRIEIIKIMRTTARNETYFTQKMIQNQRTRKVFDSDEEKSSGEEESYETKEDVPPTDEAKFDPDLFRLEIMQKLPVYRERISGIMKNVINSRIIPKENRELSIQLDDIIRSLDIDGVQRIDKMITAHKEMTEYPRSINYYTSRLDNRNRKIFDALSTEHTRLTYIILNELFLMLKDLYSTLGKALDSLKTFLGSTNVFQTLKAGSSEKQALTDAVISIENTSTELKGRSESLKYLEEYLYDKKNFAGK